MTRNNPRISINKLGEYLIAHPVRRRAIIKGQKEPSGAIVPLYRRAYPVLEDFFTSYDPNVLFDGADNLANSPTGTDWDANDASNTANALELLADTLAQLPLEELEIIKPDTEDFPRIDMAGVSVSIRPDFWVKQTRRGRDYIGALKFHWTKDDKMALGEDGGIYVATALYQYLLENGQEGRTPDHRLCFAVDAFRQEVHVAPASYRRLRTHLEAACEEIALRWDSL